jgi:hypothetical protein
MDAKPAAENVSESAQGHSEYKINLLNRQNKNADKVDMQLGSKVVIDTKMAEDRRRCQRVLVTVPIAARLR